jgi:hypothetical protein
MKNLLKIVSIIGLTAITQTAYSAAVTDTFETGDTLTAEKLNNIKDAVTDNDTRISDIALTPGLMVFSSSPTATDYNYALGTVWIDTTATAVYILADKTVGAAVWINMAGAAPNALVTYAIGDDGPAGGKVFYITDNGAHGLEAAPEDQALSEWGCYGHRVSINTVEAIGAGVTNTQSIVARCQPYVGGSVAGGAADAYTLGTYSDWFLPSKDELDELYQNRAVVGGFAIASYWSSTERDHSDAWRQDFVTGVQVGDASKDVVHRVRSVRRF